MGGGGGWDRGCPAHNAAVSIKVVLHFPPPHLFPGCPLTCTAFSFLPDLSQSDPLFKAQAVSHALHEALRHPPLPVLGPEMP